MKTLLLTGGLGYIGSHTIVEILKQKIIKLIVVDNFSNCQNDIIDRLFQILTLQQRNFIHIKTGNILDSQYLKSVFQQQRDFGTPIEGIIHYAAKKNASQSVLFPQLYYQTNVVGSLNLLKVMQKFSQCTKFIFSSTAAVYGEQDNCTEEYECQPISPYGESKMCVEMLLKSFSKVNKHWRVITLRYFNPGGNHSSGKIGDWPSNFPNNIFPVIQEVMLGKRSKLKVFGADWQTHDGSGVRDYIHVVDLAQGHLKALQKLEDMKDQKNYDVFNLGSGCGYSVFEVIKSFQNALGHPLPYQIEQRRKGDMAKLVANITKAQKILGWKARKNLQDICNSCVHFAKETLIQSIPDSNSIDLQGKKNNLQLINSKLI